MCITEPTDLKLTQHCKLTTCAKSLQLCSTLWDAMDFTLLSSSVYGILQARIVISIKEKKRIKKKKEVEET